MQTVTASGKSSSATAGCTVSHTLSLSRSLSKANSIRGEMFPEKSPLSVQPRTSWRQVTQCMLRQRALWNRVSSIHP